VYETALTLRNHFLSATGSRTLDLEYIRHGRHTLETAGLLVLTEAKYENSDKQLSIALIRSPLSADTCVALPQRLHRLIRLC